MLKKAGVKTTGVNVEMHAADRPPGTMPAFVRQVPMAKAMHPDTIIAYDMNGQPIPLVHGAPLRAIIPGWEGAYSIKWLNALNVLAKDSDSFWVATGYRYPTRRVAPGAAVDAKDMAPLTGLVVKSLITTPANGASQAVGKIAVGGFAWAGEDDIKAVDVSIDNGATWQPARLTGEQARYAWRRFEFEFNAPRPRVVSDPVARHRHEGQHAAGGIAVESVRLPLESVRFGSHRGEMRAGSCVLLLVVLASRDRRRRSNSCRPAPGARRAEQTLRQLSRSRHHHVAEAVAHRLDAVGQQDGALGSADHAEERDVLQPYLAQHFAPTARGVACFHRCRRGDLQEGVPHLP